MSTGRCMRFYPRDRLQVDRARTIKVGMRPRHRQVVINQFLEADLQHLTLPASGKCIHLIHAGPLNLTLVMQVMASLTGKEPNKVGTYVRQWLFHRSLRVEVVMIGICSMDGRYVPMFAIRFDQGGDKGLRQTLRWKPFRMLDVKPDEIEWSEVGRMKVPYPTVKEDVKRPFVVQRFVR